jgi:hypothetical protein
MPWANHARRGTSASTLFTFGCLERPLTLYARQPELRDRLGRTTARLHHAGLDAEPGLRQLLQRSLNGQSAGRSLKPYNGYGHRSETASLCLRNFIRPAASSPLLFPDPPGTDSCIVVTDPKASHLSHSTTASLLPVLPSGLGNQTRFFGRVQTAGLLTNYSLH